MTGFVRAKNHACANWGVGKVIETGDTEATVSWFDSPLADPRIEHLPLEYLQPVILERQTRVYWLDRNAGAWRVGRILDADETMAMVRFPNKDDSALRLTELEVRWDRAVEEPSAFLAEQINETPLFAQARTGFSRSLIAQRGTCSGMSGFISSVIDLEQHQYEVIKRVLQDPTQRYLLADEVGLGKTIEAGVLIRQYILDNPLDHHVLVIAPPTLVVQWRRELRKRFLLGDLLGDSVHVMAMDAGPEKLLTALSKSEMLVIDEAHHLSEAPNLYNVLRKAIIAVPRLLLLSATPVLHNERGFLEMLHLLDPHVHRLEDETAFRQRINHRQALAEAVAGLIPQNLFQIVNFIDDVTQRFPDDTLLHKHAESLRSITMQFPKETDPAFIEALAKLRAHLTETYRLDRRILRNRRRDLPFLTPPRGGLERKDYSSASVRRLIQAAEAWRSNAAGEVYGREESEHAQSLAKWFRTLLGAILTDKTQVTALVRDRSDNLVDAPADRQWEREFLAELRVAAEQCASDSDRLDALVELAQEQLQGDTKVVIFCSQPQVADAATEALQNALTMPVDRHAPHDDPDDDDEEQPWEGFISDPSHRVLVCDATAEEGLNLQGGSRTIIHLDLPLAPNRVEQRLGRADRYGSGDAIQSFALCCVDDPFAQGWLTYLNQGLKVFNRSVASLQYLIEDEMQALTQALFLDGVDALEALTTRTGGPSGSAQRELRRIDDQDALDALTLPDEEAKFDELIRVDRDWRDLNQSVQQWMIDILQIDDDQAPNDHNQPFGYGAFRFCFSYRNRGSNTLIPRKRILNTLLNLIDPQARGSHPKFLKTGWYSCRRAAAISPSAPSEGIRLVRWGEELVDRIQRLTDLDDRGRAAAMWRHHHDYRLRSGAAADTFIRFDFIVETDVAAALEKMGQSSNSLLHEALSRRGDMAFTPFYNTIWLDEELIPVKNPTLLELLESPYQKEVGNGGYQDWNVNSDRWPLLNRQRMPAIDAWRAWVPQARTTAEQLLRDETDLDLITQRAIDQARETDETRFAQLRARIRYADSTTSQEAATLLEKEERASEALYAAINEPRITLETVVAVFVSPHPLN